jgi:O-antigen ligase
VNRNHFAGFAELILPLALVPIVMGRVRKKRWPLVGLLAIVPIAALFLSGSRGGIVSFGTELAVLTLILALRGTKGKRLIAGAAILVGALLLVAWLGMGQIMTRLSSLRSVEVTEAKRASMYRDTWRIFLDHPWWGTGLGTLQIVYPPYETLYDGKVVNHTHNDYLEALAETGLLGGVCCAWFLAVLARAAWRQVREPHSSFAGTLQLSGLVACSGFLTHSLVDFNLHIPANALLFLLMAHLTTAQIPGPGSPSSPSEPRHRNP